MKTFLCGFAYLSYIGLARDGKRREERRAIMISTLQETRYDVGVDANITKNIYVAENLCGLPNVDMLAEAWEKLPAPISGRPLRCLYETSPVVRSEPQRFYLQRFSDETGVSGMGKVLTGAIFPSGRVVTEWRKPHSSVGFYESFDQFYHIHVAAHPGRNEVVFID